jgi:hypothetical protein
LRFIAYIIAIDTIFIYKEFNMNIADQIRQCKERIAELEIDLRIEKAVLLRLSAIGNDDENTAREEPRPIMADSVIPHIQAVFDAKGKPMKVAAIVKALQREGFHFEGKTTPMKLISSALTRRKDLFERVGRGLYRLKTKEGILGEVAQE